ncbi:Toll-like receptor [Operophtera brumata]|uniref:Toll-like receptor n=1 Tax=Operophtera brumata TaxID=104452 RepID=A0A0L7LS90_OPEBR|nr:Toll-like receptor [Operophtera brumata]
MVYLKMEEQINLLILTGLLTLLAAVNANLKCQTFNEKDVVCKPGTSDFILRRGLVSDNNKTTGITLRGCRITDIDYEAFHNDFSLQYIDLSINKISQLKLGVLDGNIQVTYLNLSYNMLTSFPLGIFDQKTNIEVLDLKGNKLNFLERGVLDPLRKLVHVDLSSNELVGKNIDPYIFEQSRRIKFMDFSRNDMSESPDLLLQAFQELDFLNLDKCSLTEVPAFATRSNLRTMKHLMLSTNQIRRLNNPRIFLNLDDLEILNLAENVIEEIDSNLRNVGVTLTKIFVNDNPWQCACLNDILKEMKKYNVRMETQRNMLILTGLVTLVAAVNANLKCQTFNEKDVVCKPGTSDFILRRGLVSDNNKTTGITLRGCRITELDFEAFENDFFLQYLDLSENKISQLKLGVLDGNIQVTYLNLSHNMLTSFPLGIFDEKTNIEVLDLKGNKLNFLELGVFDPLRKLVHLDLSSNELVGKNLDPYIFDQSRKIKFMDFSRNDMSVSPELLLQAFQELDFLNLDKCSLTEVPAFATRSNLKTMKHLMLSTNQIRRLNNPRIFLNLDDLEILNLAENVIEEIDSNVFTCCVKKIKMIVLRNNRIKTLPDGLFRNLNRLGNLDLSYNLIKYVPINTIQGTALKNINLSYNKFTYLEANFCLELRNGGVTLNKFFLNDNPWQCACLNDILKEMKKYNVRYNSYKLNGAQPRTCTHYDSTIVDEIKKKVIYVMLVWIRFSKYYYDVGIAICVVWHICSRRLLLTTMMEYQLSTRQYDKVTAALRPVTSASATNVMARPILETQ